MLFHVYPMCCAETLHCQDTGLCLAVEQMHEKATYQLDHRTSHGTAS